jgi:ADP-ribosylglycohydrolase
MMLKAESPNFNKMVGALIGAAVGDALGWPNEQNSKNISKDRPKDAEMFQKWVRRDGFRKWSHEEKIYPGEYSDDTQLIIATARSLRYGSGWIKHFTKVELPAWLSYERGGGGATKRAAEAWKRGNNPWNLEKEKEAGVQKYFNAGGNGVAMRILPHVFRNEGSWEEIVHQVFLNGIATHGHPKALIGAILYADALLYLLNIDKTLGYGELVDYLLTRKDKWGVFPDVQKIGSWINVANIIYKDSYMDMWDSAGEEIIDLLRIVKEGLDQGALDIGNEVLEKLDCFDKNVNGSGTITAVAAIYLASKYASSPQLALTEAAHLKNSDTDTLASMVGGLIGMLHGLEFLLMSWFNVQDYEFLKGLIYEKLVPEDLMKAPIFDYYNTKMNTKLKKMKLGEYLVAQPFGVLTLKEKRLNKSNREGSVINTLRLVSEEGQSIFVKTYEYEKGSEKKETPVHEKPSYKPPHQQTILQQQIPIEKPINVNSYKPVLDSRKLKGLVNLFPEKLEVDLCLLFIADVMGELERSGTEEIDPQGYQYLTEKWMKYRFERTNIDKAIKVILHY